EPEEEREVHPGALAEIDGIGLVPAFDAGIDLGEEVEHLAADVDEHAHDPGARRIAEDLLVVGEAESLAAGDGGRARGAPRCPRTTLPRSFPDVRASLPPAAAARSK